MALTPDFSININTELELFLNIKGRCFRDDEYQNRWKMVEDTLKKQNRRSKSCNNKSRRKEMFGMLEN